MGSNWSEATPFDIRCSKSCTRAGLTILLFSAIGISILQPIENADKFNALGRYSSLRFELKDTIDQLDADPCWQALMSSDMGSQALKEWNLLKVMEYECEPPFKSKSTQIESSPQPQAIPEKEKNKSNAEIKKGWDVPSVPSGLRLSYTLGDVQRIADIISELSDGKLLTKARSYSPRFDRAIYRWQIFLNHLLWLRYQKAGFVVISGGPPQKSLKDTGSIQRDELLKALRLENVKELSNYEYPDLYEIERLLKEMSQITLPSLGVPLSIFFGIIILEFGLLFSVAYFWLYQREARLSESFPSPGTLFGVFTRTRISRVMFRFFIALPPIASTLLAINTIKTFSNPYIFLSCTLAILTFYFSFKISRDF